MEFKGSVPVNIAAKVYGKSSEWIRAGLINGWLPIGYATKDGEVLHSRPKDAGRVNYYISPKKLYEETGFLWGGNDEH